MAAGASLVDRIDAEFAAAEGRANQLKTQQVEEFQGRQQRLEKFAQILEQLREIWRPRLELVVGGELCDRGGRRRSSRGELNDARERQSRAGRQLVFDVELELDRASARIERRPQGRHSRCQLGLWA